MVTRYCEARMAGRVKPWLVEDELWALVEPLLPSRPRRFRYPGRQCFDDRLVLQGICSCSTRGSAGSTCRKS